MNLWIISQLLLWMLAFLLTTLCIGLARIVQRLPSGKPPSEEDMGPETGAVAPVLSIEEAESKALTRIPTLGRRTLLVFASPTCSECHEIIPVLNQFYSQSYGPMDLFIVMHGDDQMTQRFIVETHPLMQTFADADKRVTELYQVPGTPFAVMISTDGIIEFASRLYSENAARILTRIVPREVTSPDVLDRPQSSSAHL